MIQEQLPPDKTTPMGKMWIQRTTTHATGPGYNFTMRTGGGHLFFPRVPNLFKYL